MSLTPTRFLSLRLGAHHKPTEGARGLVLERLDGQWVLYYLDSQDGITGHRFVDTLDDGMDYAAQEFGVRRDEWMENSDN
ncbi:MAG TPA: hypothetical protein VFI23_05825 [Rhizomicrobium sp.]|nr:hypothetical protein [Rhizomicrobium sp.]